MTDAGQIHLRRERLLSQDEDLSAFPFVEFRRNLEMSIAAGQRRARIIRRWTLIGLGIFLASIVAVAVAESTGVAEMQWVRGMIYGCGLVAMLVTGVLAGVYQYRYAPFLRRAEEQLTSVLIAELQQQVAELKSGSESR